MKKAIFLALFVFLAVLPVMAEEPSVPVINEITPAKARVDEKVTIKGSHFNADKKKNTVRFGTITADVNQASSDSLVVAVPKGARVCSVTVEVSGKRSNEFKFYVLPYLEFSLAEKNLNPGQKSRGIIRIHGSQNPWKIRVINKYYEVIDLTGGNDQVVISSGGDDNKVEMEILAKQNGNFSLVCRKIEELDESQGQKPVAVKTAGSSAPTPTSVNTSPSGDKTVAGPTPTPLDKTSGKKATGSSSDTPAPEPTPTKIVIITRTPAASPTKSTASTETPSPTPEESAIAAQTPTPSPEKSAAAVQKPTPSPTKSAAAVQKPTPSPTKSAAAVQKPTPSPTKSAAAVQKPTPSPTKSAAAVQKPTPSPTKSAAAVQKPTPSPTKSAAAVQKPTPSPAKVAESSPSPTTDNDTSPQGRDKKTVLAYCEKLKGKINLLRTEMQKLQSQIESQKEIYGRKKGAEDIRKNEKILSIGDRGKKIAKRISEIDKSLAELEKNPNDNKDKIEALNKERDKIAAEQKNLKAWKGSMASQYSKDVRALSKTIKALTDKRDSIQKQIKKLQEEYDTKLKSLIS
ncbi:MAG: IPT/TIG domain-containing protein [Candidatus Xenobiia bacterium LiM19]